MVVSLLDPYSAFGRIASGLFRPLLTLANNTVVGLANASGFSSLYRVESAVGRARRAGRPRLDAYIDRVLSAWRGRLYCNTVCPVGTLLGWFSRWAAFRLEIDRKACTKCAACLRACKAQCIDFAPARLISPAASPATIALAPANRAASATVSRGGAGNPRPPQPCLCKL